MTTTNEIPAGALYGEPAERITRPNDGETIETRLGRIEAWMRNEIFARTAMDEPDPDAGEDAKWGEVANANNGEWFRVKGQQKRDADHLPRWMAASKVAVAKAIKLGLAVSPDDPRLHPLVVTDELVEAVLNDYEQQSRREPMYRAHLDPIGLEHMRNALVAHLNAARGVER